MQRARETEIEKGGERERQRENIGVAFKENFMFLL
jgi:hypothetical protein